MVLSVCSKLGSYLLGKVIYVWIIVLDGLVDLVVENVFLDMYCSCGDVKEVFFVFERIYNLNLIVWNLIILGCLENGFGEEVIFMYGRLWRRFISRLDEYIFFVVICVIGEIERFVYGKFFYG